MIESVKISFTKPAQTRWVGPSSVVAALVLVCAYTIYQITGLVRDVRSSSDQTTTADWSQKPVVLAGVDFDLAEKTLVFIINSHCKACTESMGFYKTLTQRRWPTTTSFVAACGESVLICSRYLADHGVTPNQVVSGFPRGITITATPTIVLINRGGQVRAGWVGKLDRSKERQVHDAISHNSS